jgi:hypothetical protein
MNESFLPEEWSRVEFDENISEKYNFLISTYGRIKRLKEGKETGALKKPSYIGGYKCIPLKQKSGKSTSRYIHKLVAQTFIEKKSDEQIFVIHKDFDKENNNEWNLSWATKAERFEHLTNNPNFKNSKRNSKLTEGRVKMIKKKLIDPKRKTRMKMLAKQFGVSEMQLHRIKTGENWGYVKVD